MNFSIKSRYDHSEIYNGDGETLKDVLQKAVKGGADLYGANLYGANLRGANLYGANLRGADLRGANLGGADLYGANLYGANLRGANLSGQDITVTQLSPMEGSFIAYKSVQGFICRLEIPADAWRVNQPGSRKCRATHAKVLNFLNKDGTPTNVIEAYGHHNSNFVYRVGEMVYPDKACIDPRLECSNGIHYFLSFREAADYNA